MHSILGGHALTPWGSPHVFVGQQKAKLGLVGTYFDQPNGAFPIPWGPEDECPADNFMGRGRLGPVMRGPSRFQGVLPDEYTRRQGLQGYRPPAWHPAPFAVAGPMPPARMGQAGVGVALTLGALVVGGLSTWGSYAAWSSLSKKRNPTVNILLVLAGLVTAGIALNSLAVVVGGTVAALSSTKSPAASQ